MEYWHAIEEEGIWRCIEHVILLIVVLKWVKSMWNIEERGRLGLLNKIIKLGLRIADKVLFLKNKKYNYLEQQSNKSVKQALQHKKIRVQYQSIPQKGLKLNELEDILDSRIIEDIDPTKGNTFAYVYQHSKQHSKLTSICFQKYLHSNALNPILFNSLRVIENEVVRMSATLFHGDKDCVGNVTSCGTESLLLAMKTYRDYRGTGEVLMCVSGHPGINKGCHYVGLTPVQIPFDQSKRMSLPHLKRAISRNTVVVVCSAPQYPYGVVDDVQSIAKVCLKYGVPLHVDAAIGGFILPFLPRQIPWDFQVEGVSSINADLHKYGFAPKGSSVLIYRSSTIRMAQYFSFATWPGGIYISPTALGTRNGGCMSAAWGSLLALGIEGFTKTAKQVLDTVNVFLTYLRQKKQFQLMAEPDATIVSFKCTPFSCYQFADAMEKKGFFLQKQSNPQSLHMTFMPAHTKCVDQIISSMDQCLIELIDNPTIYENKSKAVYGMVANIPDQSIVEDFVVHYMDKIYKSK